MHGPRVSVDTVRHPTLIVLTAVGEVDGESCYWLIEHGKNVLLEPDPRPVAIDLAGVTSMDAAGLIALVRLRQTAAHVGRQLRVQHVPDPIRPLLESAQLESLCEQFAEGAPEKVGAHRA